jgi:metal-responsive CopG/Arc/MetJ family transcriptional regulator
MPTWDAKRSTKSKPPARFPGGTLDRIDRVLVPETNEKRSDFIREAVERELSRREKKR